MEWAVTPNYWQAREEALTRHQALDEEGMEFTPVTVVTVNPSPTEGACSPLLRHIGFLGVGFRSMGLETPFMALIYAITSPT